MKYCDFDFDNKTILITGGAGFIGSNLALFFQKNYPKVNIVIFDRFRNDDVFSNGNLKSLGHYNNLLNFEGQVICGDIQNNSEMDVLKKFKFDYIFHQAAMSDTRVYDQNIAIKTNANSFYFLLDLALKNKAVMVYASSAAVYGSLASPQRIGFEQPENPYGFSKYIMDNIARNYAKENVDRSILGLRYFNAYGANEFFKGNTASMIIQLGHQILSGKPPRLFAGSNELFRDFINVDDVVQANIKASVSQRSGVYNVGTGVARSFQEVADLLQKEFQTNLGTEFFENPYLDYQRHTQADISSTIKDLNYKPLISLEDGIKNYASEIILTYNKFTHA